MLLSMNAPTRQKEIVHISARAVLTGIAIGALLTPCNIYSGLKIGWSFNMSILSALLGYAFWSVSSLLFDTKQLNLHENVYSQTTASAAASIVSGGLVAPIPAYTMLTGNSLSSPVLIFWVFAVSFLGVLVAIGLREQMLTKEDLPFPSGVATAETLKDLHSGSTETQSSMKLMFLFGLGLITFSFKLINDLWMALPKFAALPFLNKIYNQWSGLSLKQVGFLIDPSFLMFGFGMIMGLRSGISLLLGSVIAWLFLPPIIISQQWIPFSQINSDPLFGELVGWMLWPGVGLMVASSLTSFSLNLFKMMKSKMDSQHSQVKAKNPLRDKTFCITLGVTIIVLSLAQYLIFGISLWMGALAVVASILLGVVSSRVSGETGIPPIGALGKITQLTFGLMNPGNISANLMTANVTGGAAGQSSDLLHDLKAGLLVNARVRYQVTSQIFGVFVGAISGSLVYIYLIPDPAQQLITSEWPAPAVATWKSVAELMSEGLSHFPPGALQATIIGVMVGVLDAILQSTLSKKVSKWLPSGSAMGLAFIIPAWTSLTMFLGALFAFILLKWRPRFSALYATVIAAACVAGESLGGVAAIILRIFN